MVHRIMSCVVSGVFKPLVESVLVAVVERNALIAVAVAPVWGSLGTKGSGRHPCIASEYRDLEELGVHADLALSWGQFGGPTSLLSGSSVSRVAFLLIRESGLFLTVGQVRLPPPPPVLGVLLNIFSNTSISNHFSPLISWALLKLRSEPFHPTVPSPRTSDGVLRQLTQEGFQVYQRCGSLARSPKTTVSTSTRESSNTPEHIAISSS